MRIVPTRHHFLGDAPRWRLVSSSLLFVFDPSGAASPNGTVMIGFTLTDSSSGQQMDSQSFPVDVQLRDAYEAAKLSTGAYNAISLSLIKAYQDDLEPLFARWQCDGPEFDRFIDGILNTPD